MLKFSTQVSITICARNYELGRWLDLFGRLFKNFSSYQGVGGWVGEKKVETETNLVITTWGPDWPTVRRLVKFARWYQVTEQQEAVSITWATQGGWQARIVFEGDWQELEDELRCVFDEDYQAELLAQWFDSRVAVAETSQGCDISDHHWQ